MLNIDVRSWLKITERNPIMLNIINGASLGMNPHPMKVRKSKRGGRENDATKDSPEYFLILEMDDCLADSSRDSISFFERPLVSGTNLVSINVN